MNGETNMSGINLDKGNRINLSKAATSNGKALTKILVKLNWTPNNTSTGTDFDLDSSVFMCKADAKGDPKLLSDTSFIFYNNTTSPDGAIVHSGDDLTGADGEQISIDLEKVSPLCQEISFVVTIHEAGVRNQNFGQVPRSSITLINEETGETVCAYNLGDDFSNETAVQFGSMYRRDDGDWAFKAVGDGHNLGLREFVIGYGGNVA